MNDLSRRSILASAAGLAFGGFARAANTTPGQIQTDRYTSEVAGYGPLRTDPFGVFARYARHQSKAPQQERVKPLHELDRQAFETLGFKGYVKADEVKLAYKRLVKIHHPDANGGDKSSEERLRAIIAAYTHLKQKGFAGR